MLQLGVSLTDDTSSFNYNRNMFIIQATRQRQKVSLNLLKSHLEIDRVGIEIRDSKIGGKYTTSLFPQPKL